MNMEQPIHHRDTSAMSDVDVKEIHTDTNKIQCKVKMKNSTSDTSSKEPLGKQLKKPNEILVMEN